MRNSIIIAVMGHVKHGKTSLVRTLTGAELNRHPEEKRRGLTINPGHAVLRLSCGREIFFVDLPGHQEYLHNAIRGLWGIDAAILVVAADEGVMPQTREHLSIVRLLGIPKVIVALTKTDRVDDELLVMAEEETRGLIFTSPYKNARMIRFSSRTGLGKDELINAVEDVFNRLPSPDPDRPFMMAIDHVFYKDGHGTVVTGSITSGIIGVDDEVEIYPSGIKDRIRLIQAGHETKKAVTAGMRAGINLSGIRHYQIKPGDLLGTPGKICLGRFINTELHVQDDIKRPIKNNSAVRLFLGTKSYICKIVIIERRDAIMPGEKALVQLRLREQAAALPFSPFIVSGLSPEEVLGGGRVLEMTNRKWRTRHQEGLDLLDALARGCIEEIIIALLKARPLSVITLDEFAISSGYPIRLVINAILSLYKDNKIIKISNGFYLYKRFHILKKTAADEIRAYHKLYPANDGMPIEMLRARFKDLPVQLIDTLIADMILRRTIKKTDNFLSLAGFKPQLGADIKVLTKKVMAIAEKSSIMPVTFHSMLDLLKIDEKQLSDAIRYLIKQGMLVRVYKNRGGNREEFMTPDALDIIKERVAQHILKNGRLTLEDAKGLFPLGRRIINILDYLDSISFTLNKGNAGRVLYPRPVFVERNRQVHSVPSDTDGS
ncbi:selenocysteine-specific translation elongation factor [Dissulfurimicrobium hydrothermale]|uniref:selenocysteine-specific translation elongation factor n=1 Tax=Dissulfurimicrobium hydrothermale TaxID=1750598 RepID=UPI001EDB6B8C|nr:selenocysteine-specific translation elongation factor [Dissulfurimicrobium hydrothermale]UKL13239.1 selenocysteine-specific translation elongation factor [Dissulfurimicrobium hydrothermale]